jgi:hypothetical protein
VSRVLKGTIHVPNDDGSITSVLAGTSEADAKKQAPEAAKSWGDHVWAEEDDSPLKAADPFDAGIGDDEQPKHHRRGKTESE